MNSEQGAALPLSLSLLLVISLLTYSSLTHLALELRLTGQAQRERQLRQAAEAALRDAEQAVAALPYPVPPCRPVMVAPCLVGDAQSHAVDFSAATTGPPGNPSTAWYVRHIRTYRPDSDRQRELYEITSRAVYGGVPSTECAVRSVCLRAVIRVTRPLPPHTYPPITERLAWRHL